MWVLSLKLSVNYLPPFERNKNKGVAFIQYNPIEAFSYPSPHFGGDFFILFLVSAVGSNSTEIHFVLYLNPVRQI